ncbi:MAG TPA: cytochrome c [Candidatus Kapabacteria bacterium]|nr:cytochrome c [Candidatus Kapabacteria bacterium]
MIKHFFDKLLSTKMIINTFAVIVLSTFIISCGGSENSGSENNGSEPQATSETKSTKEFLTVDKYEVGALNPELAAKGKEIFASKCTACHKYDTRLVGPALGEVTKRRSPEFILSMITHPDEMLKNNDTAKALLAQYMTPMTNQNITLDDAKAIFEHLRDVSK